MPNGIIDIVILFRGTLKINYIGYFLTENASGFTKILDKSYGWRILCSKIDCTLPLLSEYENT